MKQTPVQQADRHREETGCTLAAAAAMFDVSVSTLNAHIIRKEHKRLQGKVECPCCLTMVMKEKINTAALTAAAKKTIDQ